jgi:transaldolase
VGEIPERAGCELLTISPKLLGELEGAEGQLPLKLDPCHAPSRGRDRIEMTVQIFRKQNEEDRMANDKLDEGIQGFSKAIVALEGLLTERLKTVAGKAV